MLSFGRLIGRRHSSRGAFYERIQKEIDHIQESGLFKREIVLASAQAEAVKVAPQLTEAVNFCANNYLGLANHPALLAAGVRTLAKRGAGMSSVRFICGTQDIHRQLEAKLSEFHGTEDSILYTSCFDANAGLFETILGSEDCVLSDSLNHASIIDGIRLCKAKRVRFQHGDMQELEGALNANQSTARTMLIATDGVFSMDGDIANLPQICKLAQRYGAMVFVDDSHATGFVGPRGRGTPEYFGLEVDIISSTLGKALGGSSGGYTTGKRELIALLRQRSRPYLFSNSLPPVVATFALTALRLVDSQPRLRERLAENTQLFRSLMERGGYQLMGSPHHPICPVLVGDAKVASAMAADLRELGILVVAFSYPVVPEGRARIRVQVSAAHTKAQIRTAVEGFIATGKKYRLLK